MTLSRIIASPGTQRLALVLTIPQSLLLRCLASKFRSHRWPEPMA